VKNIIAKLEDASIPKEEDINRLDDKVEFIKKISQHIAEVVNVYNTAASKKLAEEAKKIADEAEVAAKKAKEDVDKKKADTAYIKQIENATTVEDAMKVADELFSKFKSNNNHPATDEKALHARRLVAEKALHALRLVAEKAYKDKDFVSTQQNGNFMIKIADNISQIRTRMLLTIEPKSEAVMAMGYTIIVYCRYAEKNPKFKSYILHKIDPTLMQWLDIDGTSEEAKKVVEEAKKAKEALKIYKK